MKSSTPSRPAIGIRSPRNWVTSCSRRCSSRKWRRRRQVLDRRQPAGDCCQADPAASHVFAEGDAKTPDEVKQRWDEIKRDEARESGKAEADFSNAFHACCRR